MYQLPIVAAGEYDSDRVLAVFATVADAEVYAAKFNAERGYGLFDGERARVEYLPAFPAGDPGISGHEVKVEWKQRRWAESGWVWYCTCRENGETLSEQVTREQAAAHIAHWVPAPEQVALPS
ncbi:hypothetical protein AB0J77_14790 [Micromonospora tulbaghiae]|uniref:hypothetical protein n=1 Tax=Micromonospora tulbaghiae TaxID=479978 RepID=UPI00341C07EA